jgi:1-phosphofructokinase/tagatose 6-phosphate kinase
MGFAGGHSGQLMADLAQKEGLPASWSWTEAETRTCTILVPEDQDATVINEPGTAVSAMDWQKLQQDVKRQLALANLICISGSLPPNSSSDGFGNLLSMLVAAGKQVWVDSSGTSLKTANAKPAICIKVNADEFGEAFGLELNDFSSIGQALDRLGDRAPAACVITLGSAGAFLAVGKRKWSAQGPRISVVSTVGSGDSFLGGFIAELNQSEDWSKALESGVAAGSANALSAGGGRFTLHDFQTLREQIQVQTW